MGHFEGKTPLEHLTEARKKGIAATQEIHGTELSGFRFALLDGAKEGAILFLLINPFFFSIPLMCAYLLWKTGRSALLGYNRLERLHRLIQEERYEIEHHRPEEKEELYALYQAKGFSGKLLDEVVHTLMADDNRLLEVMLREELGLPLESMEHPLKQALGALLGGAIGIASALLFPLPFFLIAISSFLIAKWQRNDPIKGTIWHLSLGAVAFLLTKIYGE